MIDKELEYEEALEIAKKIVDAKWFDADTIAYRIMENYHRGVMVGIRNLEKTMEKVFK